MRTVARALAARSMAPLLVVAASAPLCHALTCRGLVTVLHCNRSGLSAIRIAERKREDTPQTYAHIIPQIATDTKSPIGTLVGTQHELGE